MKLLLLILLLSSKVNASDLIFKQGFENTGLIAGVASGINASGLRLNLSVNSEVETLVIDSNGRFVFDAFVSIGDTWSVSILSLPTNPISQNCTLNNATGIMVIGGAGSLQVNCEGITLKWDLMNWNNGDWN